MNLVDQVRHALTEGGCVSQVLTGFNARVEQCDMAEAVARAISDGGKLVVEAGTGVGKTFAYLVPALLSGERVLISTATKALQDQLFARDLPRLLKALGVPVQIALLKGRSSYLCAHRLSLARHEPQMRDEVSTLSLAKLEVWARQTRSGDLAEVPDLDERSPVIPWVTSTRENCLGSDCPQFRGCHVNSARREAMAADLVVVNHHLFFADMAVRESGIAELLPSVRVVIFDEAHQLNDIGVRFLGTNWGTSQIIDFARDVLAVGVQFARGLVDWRAIASDLEQAARELRMCLGEQVLSNKLRWTEISPEGVHPQDWLDALGNLQTAFEYAGTQLSTVSELSPDFVRLSERASEHQRKAQQFLAPCPLGAVRWIELGARNPSPLRLIESPLDIANVFQPNANEFEGSAEDKENLPASEQVLSAEIAQSSLGDRKKTWVFTSATLGNENKLKWFCESCGLLDAQILRVQSPFQYDQQASLYVPTDLPRPADPSHTVELAFLVARAVRRLGGRTLVLTTSLRALRKIGEILQEQFPIGDDIEILVQGQQPKRYLMSRFRDQGAALFRGSVLVASATFWEGFDVPGDALQLVVIDKLPFPPPNDPLVQARTLRIEAAGRSPFNDYFIPEAAISLKQGAGRLIRHETDTGVLIVGDSRLVEMSYGKRILKALPNMTRLGSEAELMATLDQLNIKRLP